MEHRAMVCVKVDISYLLTLAVMYLACPLQLSDLFPSNGPVNHDIKVIKDTCFKSRVIERASELFIALTKLSYVSTSK